LGTAVSVVGNSEPNLALTGGKLWYQKYSNKQNQSSIDMIQSERKNNETQCLNINVDQTKQPTVNIKLNENKGPVPGIHSKTSQTSV
jgi:hypothetical protein